LTANLLVDWMACATRGDAAAAVAAAVVLMMFSVH